MGYFTVLEIRMTPYRVYRHVAEHLVVSYDRNAITDKNSRLAKSRPLKRLLMTRQNPCPGPVDAYSDSRIGIRYTQSCSYYLSIDLDNL